jgi:beta-mannanase
LFGGTWGDSPWDGNTVAKFERDAGKRMSIEHYGQPPPWAASFDMNAAQLVAKRGAIAAIDMSSQEVPLAKIAAGRYDASIKAWADAARSFGHPFFLLFDEEMNGNWYPYSPGMNGNTAVEFVAMWRHVHDVVQSEGASNVTWVWCPNIDPNHMFTSYSALYPGDAYVDWTCLNGYNWGRNQWLTFNQIFAKSYRELLSLAPDKPIMIGEMSSNERGGSKGAWITNALSQELPRRYQRIKAVLWFNWLISQDGRLWPWEIESSAASQKAFARATQSSYYAPGGGFGKLPLLTKVRPLG